MTEDCMLGAFRSLKQKAPQFFETKEDFELRMAKTLYAPHLSRNLAYILCNSQSGRVRKAAEDLLCVQFPPPKGSNRIQMLESEEPEDGKSGNSTDEERVGRAIHDLIISSLTRKGAKRRHLIDSSSQPPTKHFATQLDSEAEDDSGTDSEPERPQNQGIYPDLFSF
eukprot:Polyplicarium_translucidae@DN639_c0_g1_i1.p1